jgi:hypothetical protein
MTTRQYRCEFRPDTGLGEVLGDLDKRCEVTRHLIPRRRPGGGFELLCTFCYLVRELQAKHCARCGGDVKTTSKQAISTAIDAVVRARGNIYTATVDDVDALCEDCMRDGEPFRFPRVDRDHE